MDFIKRVRKFAHKYSLDHYRLVHSFKTALGCLIGLALVSYLRWPSGQWVPITIMVVMSAQTHFGGALKKAYMRFLGTFCGIVITLLVLLTFDNNYIAMFATVFIACAIFTYIASGGGDLSYAGTLGGVTVILTLTGLNANIEYALERGVYIVIGIIIALLVSRLVFPIHARDRLRDSVAKALRDLQKLYIRTLESTRKELSIFTLDDRLDSVLLVNLDDQPSLIEEAAAGSSYFSRYRKTNYIEIVKIERKIYRLIYFMRRVLHEDEWLFKVMHKVKNMPELNAVIENSLTELANYFENDMSGSITIDLVECKKKIRQLIKEMPQEEKMQKLLDEHSLLFFIEQIVDEISGLYQLAEKIT
jgi:uncharacterized membrane protein YgaE (UPF0421/DUF939 family)